MDKKTLQGGPPAGLVSNMEQHLQLQPQGLHLLSFHDSSTRIHPVARSHEVAIFTCQIHPDRRFALVWPAGHALTPYLKSELISLVTEVGAELGLANRILSALSQLSACDNYSV